MKENLGRDRNLVALAATSGVFLLFLVAYLWPRLSQLSTAREAIVGLTATRQEVAVLLPQVAQTAFTTQEPTGKVSAWVSDEALRGIDAAKQVVGNDSYLEGKGAKVQLRRLSPQQAAKFLSQLTKVRLVVERMTLQDSDGDGRWDIDIDLKVPDAK